MSQVSELRDDLLKLLEQHKVIDGTEKITIEISTSNCKTFVLKQLRALERSGHITIIPSRGGRGKRTVYKRNRNSTGQRRKVRP